MDARTLDMLYVDDQKTYEAFPSFLLTRSLSSNLQCVTSAMLALILEICCVMRNRATGTTYIANVYVIYIDSSINGTPP
jgi:hypothetical protein